MKLCSQGFVDTESLNLLLTGASAICSSYTRTTTDLDNLQTTRVTKDPREVSDKPDVSVDSNSHSFALIAVNCVIQVLRCNEETKKPAKHNITVWRTAAKEEKKKEKKTIPRLKTCVLWLLANYEFVESAFLKVALLIQRLQPPLYHITLHLLTIHEKNVPDGSPFTAINQSILAIEGNERVNHAPGWEYLHVCPLHQQEQQVHLLFCAHLL